MGGDDSVSKTPLGDNIFLICQRGVSTRRLLKLVPCSQVFIDLLRQGYLIHLADCIRFFTSLATNLLYQPALFDVVKEMLQIFAFGVLRGRALELFEESD